MASRIRVACAPRRAETPRKGYYVTGGSYTWQQVYAILPTNEPWSCPFSATAGDHTLYELSVAAYQAGTGAVDSQASCAGGIPTPTAPGAPPAVAPLCNQWYVQDVSTYLVDLSEGTTPT